MWQDAHSFLCQHPKFLGITGDSMTFAGSILLALEALFKEAQFVSINRKAKIVLRSKYAEDASGKPLDPSATEAKWRKLWIVVNRFGAFVLVGGFACLLANRIFAE
jgi:hypothetical protein